MHCPFLGLIFQENYLEDILEMSVRAVCTLKVKNMYAKLIFRNNFDGSISFKKLNLEKRLIFFKSKENRGRILSAYY